ncbi:MAG TPA: hypothetical protein VLT62_21110 [Candidatus Methylomirabilis sp.]|nr:hypothetical protein [Candidatus Methylomirabilis sp.]
MEWVVLAIVGFVVLVFVLSRLSKSEPDTDDGTTTQGTRTDTYQPPAPVTKRGPSRLLAAEVIARARDLQTRNAQWPEIWTELNPGSDPSMQQLLLDLRNDGLQFAPHDGLRRIELAAESLATIDGADAATVLKKILGQTDLLDKFK